MKSMIDDMAHVDLEEDEQTREMYYGDDGESVTGTICTRRNNYDENRFTGVNLNLKKEAIIDTWQDSSPRYRVSVQFLVESGLQASDKIDVHVSSCGNFLEITKPVSEFVTDVDKALIFPKINKQIANHKQQLITLLSNHTRYVARRATIKKLNESVGINTKLNYKWLLSLPFRCRPELVTQDEDDHFHGMKFVEFHTGEIWCYVELVKSSSEAYFQRNNRNHQMHMIREDIDKEEEEDEFYPAECEGEEAEETLYEEPDEAMGSNDDSTIEEAEGIPSRINVDHSHPQPTVAQSYHTAPDEQSKAVVSFRSGRTQGFNTIYTPTGSKTVVSNTSGKFSLGASKSFKSVPNISNALTNTRKPVTRSVKSKRVDQFRDYFDDYKKRNSKELQDVKEVLDRKFPALKTYIRVPEDKSSSTNFMSLHEDEGSLRITNGLDNFSVAKPDRKLPARKPGVSTKRKKSKSDSSSSHSSGSSTVHTKNTKAALGSSSNAMVVHKPRRVTRSNSKKTKTGFE